MPTGYRRPLLHYLGDWQAIRDPFNEYEPVDSRGAIAAQGLLRLDSTWWQKETLSPSRANRTGYNSGAVSGVRILNIKA